MIGAGEHHAIVGLPQAQDVALVQAVVRLAPGGAAIVGDEEAAEVLIVDHANINAIGVLVIHHHATHDAMSKAAVGSFVGYEAVVAGEHAATVGRDQYVVGICWDRPARH